MGVPRWGDTPRRGLVSLCRTWWGGERLGGPLGGGAYAGGLVSLIRDMVGRGENRGWPRTVPLVGMGWGLAQ